VLSKFLPNKNQIRSLKEAARKEMQTFINLINMRTVVARIGCHGEIKRMLSEDFGINRF
jgi:hypothetical protein